LLQDFVADSKQTGDGGAIGLPNDISPSQALQREYQAGQNEIVIRSMLAAGGRVVPD